MPRPGDADLTQLVLESPDPWLAVDITMGIGSQPFPHLATFKLTGSYDLDRNGGWSSFLMDTVKCSAVSTALRAIPLGIAHLELAIGNSDDGTHGEPSLAGRLSLYSAMIDVVVERLRNGSWCVNWLSSATDCIKGVD